MKKKLLNSLYIIAICAFMIVLTSCINYNKKAMFCIRNNDCDKLAMLIHDDSINVADGRLLEYACEQGNISCIRLLIENGAQITRKCVDTVIKKDDIALMQYMMTVQSSNVVEFATSCLGYVKSKEMAYYLLAHGCNPYFPEEEAYYMPLVIADKIAFKIYLKHVGLNNIRKVHLDNILQEILDVDDDPQKLEVLISEGLSPSYKLYDKTLLEYAKEEIPFETIYRPRAPKCAKLLSEL